MQDQYSANTDASLRNYSEFVRNLPIAVYRVTVEGKIVFCNEPFVRIFGFESIRDAIGFPVIHLYRNKKDRGTLVQAVLRGGRITDAPVAFLRRDNTPVWCAVTAKAVLDDEGTVVFIDGSVRDITGEIGETQAQGFDPEQLMQIQHAAFVLDLHGAIMALNDAAAAFAAGDRPMLTGRSFAELLAPADQQLFFLFLGDTLKSGYGEVVLRMKTAERPGRYLSMIAAAHKSDGRVQHFSAVVQDVTNRMQQFREKTNREKFQGVLEMAGGVAHRLNQPLTVVTNMVNEIFAGLDVEDPNYARMARLNEQIRRMNEITHKIGNIKKYEAIDYVAGIKIVDIDRAS
jgi:PAS domain S-box-containing protein